MNDYILTKTFTAGADVAKHRLVMFGDADGTVVPAATEADAVIGVAAELDVKSGGRIDVHLAGVAPVEASGAIARGAPLGAAADGKVAAASGARLFQKTVDGAAADTDIAVTGLLATDELVSVIELATGYADRTANASIASAGNIQVTDATTGDKLLVTWRRPGRTAGIALEAATTATGGDLIPALILPGLA